MTKPASLLCKLAILFLFPLISCEETIIEKEREGKVYTIEGFAQKGPFIVGTDVTVAELNDKLFPTGLVYFATVLDDEGSFSIPGVVLTSPYVQIKIRGIYFSEVWGYNTNKELTLYAFADVRKSENINVNIITHLESERVAHLVQKENLSFEEAKAKAFKEFLTIFEWDNLSVSSAESLTITKNDDGGAVLLAVASIFERVQDDFIKRLETITNFRTDFADGKIESTLIQNRLLTAASLLDEKSILATLKFRFGAIAFPEFGALLDQFKENSTYTNYTTFNNVFPTSVGGKLNLLTLPNNTTLDPTTTYYILTNPPDGLQNATIAVTINLYYAFSFILPPDPEIRFHGEDLYGSYYYSSNSNVWTQKSIPIQFISDSGNRQGSCTYSLHVDGFLIILKNNWFKY
jgi:hypothetical protein